MGELGRHAVFTGSWSKLASGDIVDKGFSFGHAHLPVTTVLVYAVFVGPVDAGTRCDD